MWPHIGTHPSALSVPHCLRLVRLTPSVLLLYLAFLDMPHQIAATNQNYFCSPTNFLPLRNCFQRYTTHYSTIIGIRQQPLVVDGDLSYDCAQYHHYAASCTHFNKQVISALHTCFSSEYLRPMFLPRPDATFFRSQCALATALFSISRPILLLYTSSAENAAHAKVCWR